MYWGGLAESARKNPLSDAGHATCHQLNPKVPLTVNYIMAVAVIPKAFDRVKTIRPARDGQSVTLIARSGSTVAVPLDLNVLEISTLQSKAAS